ncbi:MAG: DUF5590 domain-containing protein [Paenibacillaceae bacterium]
MKKSTVIIVGIMTSFLILVTWFYFSAKDGFTVAEREAIDRALQESTLTEVDHVEFFAGATNYTVLFGNNIDGEKLLVWVGDEEEEIHEEKASEGVSKSTIRKQVVERQGAVTFVHITPGKLGELWIWEVFYKKKENDGVRHYYDFYNFADGEWLDTYTLSLED